MEKEQYLAALRSSVSDFDALRKQDTTASIDISGADLSGANLQGAPFLRVNLRDVNFEGADLTKANLSRADLRGARFKNAKLIDVNFHRAEMEGADLRGAVMGGLDGDAQVCLYPCLFSGVHWGKGEMEHFLEVLNQNEDWEIRYELVPKPKAS